MQTLSSRSCKWQSGHSVLEELISSITGDRWQLGTNRVPRSNMTRIMIMLSTVCLDDHVLDHPTDVRKQDLTELAKLLATSPSILS